MRLKDTFFSVKQTINCGGTILDLGLPKIMGIMNITPDSFYDGGVYHTEGDILAHVEKLLEEGADIIDVGGYSSRPGAAEISSVEEMNRVKKALHVIRLRFPEILLSIDTFRSDIAAYAVKEYGVNMINDISGGQLDENMLPTTGSLHVPYIMMHMKGIPRNMQDDPRYGDILKDLLVYFAERTSIARDCGIKDIIVDPGFGFGKSMGGNYALLHHLRLFEVLGYPIMAGLSRKSMIYKALDITASESLNGTSSLNALALVNGAKILRVHDVKEAVQTVKLITLYQKAGNY